MLRSRSFLVALLGGIALAGLFASWLFTGHSDARARARAIREAPIEVSSQRAAALANELGAALEAIRSGEDARAYFEYQNLFHDPRGASSGLSVSPSPLASRTASPLVAVHYQVSPQGELTIPTVNDELPELSQQAELLGNQAQLARLRAARRELGAELTRESPPLLAVNTPAPRARARRSAPRPKPPVAPQQAQAPPQQQVQLVDPEVFTQNVNANAVFQTVQGQGVEKPTARRPRRKKKAESPRKPIEIRIASFAWRTSMIDEAPRIVATRTVDTPTGTLAQGFVVDAAAMESWLAARGEDKARVIRTVGDAPVERVSAPIPGVPEWAVAIDTSAALAAAHAEARRVQARFWWWFLPAAGVAIAALFLVVWVVMRAERLARERSKFAAAAAHELRTPLAGLQLYGEMLADGLGDPSQAHNYAQRVSDEAARLGRVVNNVLGFTQLERGALAVDAQPGDVAEATRRAVERSRKALEAAGVMVEVDVPERVLARFDDDAHARIVTNLIDNAEKYSRESSERRITVSLREEADFVIVSVTDSGAGVPASHRERIFKPFARNVDDDGAAGLGLGLALARTLARDQGGDLACVESDGRGARFDLRLPAV